MITEKLTTLAVSGLLVAGLGTPLALQHHAKRNLEAENQTLRQQVALVDQLRAENQLLAAVHLDPDEADRLRRDNAELHRLRGEVALLRREQEQASNWKEIEGHNRTILIREKEPRLSPDGLFWSRAYGFADGHSEMRTEPTGDFNAWEQERMVPQAPW